MHRSLNSPLCILFSFSPIWSKLWGAYLCSHMERLSLMEFTFDDTPILLLCMVTAPWTSVVCLCWHLNFTMVGTVILSELVTSSFHSQILQATLKLLQKAFLASFYFLVTSHFDLLSFGVIPCRNTASQLSATSDVSLDTQNNWKSGV